jgi:hypothetical protein
MRRVELDFSGIGLRLDGMTDELALRLEQDWAPFVARDEAPPFLCVKLELVDGSGDLGSFLPKEMTSVLEPRRAEFGMPQGRAEVDDTGLARVRLVRDLGSMTYYTLQNLLRACLAWRLPARGAAMLHAAGLVIDGRAFVLVGPEGCGKSTWARCAEEAGAEILSDDLVLVEGTAEGAEALGSPLRSTHRSPLRPGRWPLAALLFPRHGETAVWEPSKPLLARARLAANLPFVSAALECDPRVAFVVERLVTRVPCKELTFSPDPSFVELLRGSEG